MSSSSGSKGEPSDGQYDGGEGRGHVTGAVLIAENLKDAGESQVELGHNDPYLQFVEMPLSAVFYPLGFPVRVTTNCAEILEAAEESWGDFRQALDMPPIQINIGLIDDGSTECPPAPVSRAQQNLLIRVADGTNFFAADLRRGVSFGWLSSAAIAHRSYLRYHFLEASALSHIANRFTAPVHAACVERRGKGILLCGESGAGKSSLAFACARAGWTYITDDASFLLHGESGRRVVGDCHLVRLRPSAAELFDGVAGRPLIARAGGKPSIEIRMSAMPEIHRATKSNVDYVVFLNRKSSDPPELLSFPTEAARNYIHKNLWAMEELHAVQIATVDRLLTAQIFELRYRDLNWAVERLERLVGDGE